MNRILCTAIVHALLLSGTGLAVSGDVHAQPATLNYQVQAGDLDAALKQFASQSRIQLIYDTPTIEGKRSAGLTGSYSSREALRRLLDGQGVVWEFVDDVTVVIKKAEDAPRPARRAALDKAARTAEDERIVGMPAIMVEGTRTLNIDITRTRDDPQPYVVFDRDLIERSGATTLEQLLQQRLPMNSAVGSVGNGMRMDDFVDLPAPSGISLRGLGPEQTLILIDGHRMSSPAIGGSLSQGEISGIPLAAVERIEILPSTASGIYGGSATGGVINIITRKDYSGGEVRLTYDNTFSSDSAIRKVDAVFGHNFNEGRTNILLSASYSDANELNEADRNFAGPGRERIRSNNPGFYSGAWAAPLGRTPNIVSADGSELVLKQGNIALGSSYTSVPLGYGGVATDGGAALANNAGSYNWDLPSGTLGLGRTLYSEPTVKSGTLVLRHRFTDSLQAFLDLSSSESRRRFLTGGSALFINLPADVPNNPFTTAVQVYAAVPFESPQQFTTERTRVVGGIIKNLPKDWLLGLDYTWDRTKLDYNASSAAWYYGNVVAEGGVDIMRDLEAFPADISQYLIPTYGASNQTTMKDSTLRVSGPLGNLPGGRAVLSAALAYRDESVPDVITQVEPTIHWLYPARSTSVSSAYLEYRLPFFSEKNARTGLRELELQLAVRGEEYTSRSGVSVRYGGPPPYQFPEAERAQNEFKSVDPTIALRWKPVDDLALRLSYGTGFRPPTLYQLVPITSAQTGFLYSATSDPRRGNTTPAQFTAELRGNPDLKPEKSESLSGGVIFTPTWLPGLRVSVDYTRIEKTDNIAEIPGFMQGVIDNESLFPDLVVRGPNLDTDPPGWAGPIVHVRWIPMNMARAEVEAWDTQLDYRFDTEAHGSFELYMVGTWQTKYAVQFISGQPMLDYVGVGGTDLSVNGNRYPLKFKGNGGVAWSLSAWRLGWNVNYFSSYEASRSAVTVANQGNGGKVPSQAYHDVFVNYDFGLSGADLPGWLGSAQVQLGIRNIFDKRPPFDAGSTTSYYSQYGSPRLSSYYLTLTSRF